MLMLSEQILKRISRGVKQEKPTCRVVHADHVVHVPQLQIHLVDHDDGPHLLLLQGACGPQSSVDGRFLGRICASVDRSEELQR
jgi:hypothetical protein